MPEQPTRIVSFSGIDGAGKSTQICTLQAQLSQAGFCVRLLTFWDDIVVFPRFRELVSYKAFGGDQGAGTPTQPLNRRDKNVSWWPVTAVRFLLYLADSVSLKRTVGRIQKTGVDVVIFDRYIYDELANLPLNCWLARAYARWLLKLVPRPDAAFLIDADPVSARERKPEYPLEFLRRNRESYVALSRLSGHMTLIDPLSIEATEARVAEAFAEELSPIESRPCTLPARR